MNLDWSNKTVFVTGASSGIGRALVVELARRGAALGLFARRAEALQATAEAVRAAGGAKTHVLAVAGDVRNMEDVREAVRQVTEALGAVDVLIANAGIGVPTPARDFPLDEAAEVINVNVIGAMNCVATVLPAMLERGAGQLVAVSSLAASRGLPGSGAYCASKAALSSFFESLRVELRGSGVGITTLHPGFVRTPMTDGRAQAMPFLLEVEDAARLMVRAIESRKTSYSFPWQLAGVVRLVKFLPDALYDRLLARERYRQ